MQAKVVVQPCEYENGFVSVKYGICGPDNAYYRATEDLASATAVRQRISTLHAEFDGKRDAVIQIWSVTGSRKVPGFDKVMAECRPLLFCHATL